MTDFLNQQKWFKVQEKKKIKTVYNFYIMYNDCNIILMNPFFYETILIFLIKYYW